jgi:hypothetical protein
MPRPTPETVQQAARRVLDEPPRFRRADGGHVNAGDVPEDTRKQLEGARRAFLNHVATNPGVARRLSEAIDREDREAVSAVVKEIPGMPRDMTFTVTELVADNFRCSCSGCLFGFCCECTLAF